MNEKIKILIVDDHEIFRNGLKMVINKIPNVQVTGEASNGEEFLESIQKDMPHIVFMDIEMPKMNGIEATEKAIEKHPKLKIIALTMFNEDDYIQSMIDAGVKGFLIKNVTKDILNAAIEKVFNGGNYYSPELFDFFTRKMTKDENRTEKFSDIDFTRREKEILQLLAEGLNNKEIGEQLHISERTVIGHKSNLLQKTGCKSTISLLSYAIKNRLVHI